MARQEIDLTTPQPNGKMGEPTKSAWEKVNDMTEELYNGVASTQGRSFISGLGVEYVSPSSIRILSGSAYVPSVQKVVTLVDDVVINVSGIPSNSFSHVYLKEDATVEVVSTGPSPRYSGFARTKNLDDTRRYIFSIYVLGVSIARFSHMPSSGVVLWNEDIKSAPFQIASGSPTTSTSVSAATAVPPTSVSALVCVLNFGTAAYCFFSNANGPTVPGSYTSFVAPGSTDVIELALTSSLTYTYAFDVAGNTAFHRVRGYRFER